MSTTSTPFDPSEETATSDCTTTTDSPEAPVEEDFPPIPDFLLRNPDGTFKFPSTSSEKMLPEPDVQTDASLSLPADPMARLEALKALPQAPRPPEPELSEFAKRKKIKTANRIKKMVDKKKGYDIPAEGAEALRRINEG